jgi:hypothetical protein
MNPEPLVYLLNKLRRDALAGLKGIATQYARNLNSQFKIGIDTLKTKIFVKYGLGNPEEQHKQSIIHVCKHIYDDLFGNIDMTLFAKDCEDSHPVEQYNTLANALDARRDCYRTNIEAVAAHYKTQIDYLFKMQQFYVHPKLVDGELRTPTDYDRMIFIIDLMCSPDEISYELGIRDEAFLRGYKTAKCGGQIQHVATVQYNRKGEPKKPEYSALKVVGRPFGHIKTMEDVVSHSPALPADWRSQTRKYFKNQPSRIETAIPKELSTDLVKGEFKMPRYVWSKLRNSAKNAIKSANRENTKSASAASEKAKKTLHSKTLDSFGFTRKQKGKKKH